MVRERASALPNSPACRIIAVLDDGHDGDPDQARRLIDAAREAGANGVKFKKQNIFWSAASQATDHPGRSRGYCSQGPLESPELTVEALTRLCEHAKDLDVVLAPYDMDAYQQLRGMPFAAWKVDSALAIHLPLLERLGVSEKPILASVGGCTHSEVVEMLGLLGNEVTLIHSLCMYPFTAGVLDVVHVVALRRFERSIGYADNSHDISLSLMAVALGATTIEKPLRLRHATVGRDGEIGITPLDFGELVRRIRALERILNEKSLRNPAPSEMDHIQWARVSIVAACSIPRGTKITRAMLALKPPALGLSPRFLGFLEGRPALYDISKDEFLTFGMVEL